MKRLTPLALGISILAMTSCGGGGGMIAEGGIGGTGVTMGRVSGFGSLFVNGVEFDTSSADFIYEGQTAETPGDASGIRVGMVVRITGDDDGVTGIADIVEYASLLEGTLDSNSIGSNGTGTLVAMGQTVSADADTVYHDGGSGILLSELPLGAIIEVSGFSDGNGNLLATRIEVEAQRYSGEILNVKGLVSGLDTTNKTFMLGDLIVDYNAIELSSGITEGVYVEAKGSLQADTLIASKVEIEDDGDLVIAEDGEEAELEGLVTDILATSTDSTLLVVNGQQVLVDENTRFESGDATGLALGQPLEVSGVMDSVTLIAAEVELKAAASQKEELEAIPSNIDASAGTITLLDQTIRVTALTIFEDDLTEDSQTFNLSSLTAGEDYVSIDLYQTTDGEIAVLEASKVERGENPSPDSDDFAEVEGYVQEVDSTQSLITVVNVTVDVSSTKLSGYSFNLGDRVEIFGIYDATTGILQADEVTLENDES
jgi:hypothetical protein